MTGKTISHYKILEKLGGGGMGVVYKAEDTKLERTVALKFLPPEWTRDEDAKARFLHEAKAASKLDHPNICTIHEIGETDDGQLFIAMAYYDGETLKEKVSRNPLSVSGAIEIAIQIAQGLAYQIVHVYAYRGETDMAFEWLEPAYQERDPGVASIGASPLVRNIKKDPRFAAFMKKMKLPF
ncbi:MAG: serine/threonine-protein kinase [bacterium]